MKRNLWMAAAMAVALVAAGSVWAGQTPASKPSAATSAKQAAKRVMRTHVATGSIISANDNTLVLSHRVKGKSEQTSFSLTPATQRKGELKAGSKATVHYNIENGQDVATLVQAGSSASAAKMPRGTESKPKS